MVRLAARRAESLSALPYWQRCVTISEFDAAAPGFVTTTAALPFSAPHSPFLSTSVVNVFDPVSSPFRLIFVGVNPPTVTAASSRMLLPCTMMLLVAASNSYDVSTAAVAWPLVDELQVNVTCTPCSLPSAQPAGSPACAAVRFRLVPPVPCTKIRNVLPAFADPKLKNASIRFGFTTTNGFALIRFAGLPLSNANTDVTPPTIAPFAPGVVNVKHAPVINTSCATAQLPLDGVTEITTGALTPRFNAHTLVRVNAPKMLLSPAVNVVVTVTVAGPPQHAAGKPDVELAPKLAEVGTVARTRLQLTGVTL